MQRLKKEFESHDHLTTGENLHWLKNKSLWFNQLPLWTLIFLALALNVTCLPNFTEEPNQILLDLWLEGCCCMFCLSPDTHMQFANLRIRARKKQTLLKQIFPFIPALLSLHVSEGSSDIKCQQGEAVPLSGSPFCAPAHICHCQSTNTATLSLSLHLSVANTRVSFLRARVESDSSPYPQFYRGPWCIVLTVLLT